MRGDAPENVLMVSNYPSDTAYAWWLMEHFWVLLAEAAQERGGRTYLAYPKITAVPPRIAASSIQTVELPVLAEGQGEWMAAAAKFIRDNRITVLYLIDQPYLSAQYPALRRLGVRRIVVHDHTPGDRPPVSGIKGALKALVNAVPLWTADLILNVSPLMRQRSLENGRIPPHKCVTVQNGITPIQCDADTREATRARLELKSAATAIVSSGRAHPYKRFDFIVDCARSLQDLAPHLEFVFLLIGDGPAMAELQSQVSRLQLQSRVRLLGFRQDVKSIICAADIAMHASLGEGFSLSIVEYMSAGLPVLVPDIPSVSQAISHGRTGIVYAAHDAPAAAVCIRDLIVDGASRQSMGQAAKRQADTEFNLDRCTADFVKVAHERIVRG